MERVVGYTVISVLLCGPEWAFACWSLAVNLCLSGQVSAPHEPVLDVAAFTTTGVRTYYVPLFPKLALLVSIRYFMH